MSFVLYLRSACTVVGAFVLTAGLLTLAVLAFRYVQDCWFDRRVGRRGVSGYVGNRAVRMYEFDTDTPEGIAALRRAFRTPD